MATDHAKRAFEILREEGPVELFKQSNHFLKYRLSVDEKRFRINTGKNHLMNVFQYKTPPDPKTPIFINPNNVEYGRYGFSTAGNGLGKIKGGAWDNKSSLEKITHDYTIEGIKQRFQENRDWDETVYYEKFKSKYNGDEGRVRERCAYVDSLYEDIKNNGYKPASNDKNERQRSGYGQYLEVLVVIDRKGRIHHQGKGSHRLGISKILDINIPVQVLVRHKKWQELRDDIYNNGLPEGREDLGDHPDLQDILN